MTQPGQQVFNMIENVTGPNGVVAPAYAEFTDYLVQAGQPLGPRIAQATYTPILTEATRYIYLVIAIYVFLLLAAIVILLWAAGHIRWYWAVSIIAVMLTVVFLYLGFIGLYASDEITQEAETLGNEASQLVLYSFSSLWRDVLYAATYA